MAAFTMYLKEVIESVYGTSMDPDDFEQEYSSFTYNGVTYGKLPTLPEYVSLGLGTYPIFNEAYRGILNGKIIDEYYNQEIGTETIDNFVFNLRKKMDQIMPFYNQLYESTEIPYSALDSMRIQSAGSGSMTGEETGSAENTNNTKGKSGSRNVNSQFPQSQLAGNADYATSAADSNSSSDVEIAGTQNNSSSNNSTSNNENLVTGYQGAASDLINKYRNSLINVDNMVIQEISDCFMLLLNSGDEYFARANYGGY